MEVRLFMDECYREMEDKEEKINTATELLLDGPISEHIFRAKKFYGLKSIWIKG